MFQSDKVGGHIKAKSDKEINRRGEEYNRALTTVAQNKKEQEITQGALQNILMMQQVQVETAKLKELAANLKIQQDMMTAQLAAPVPVSPPGQELPMMPGQQLPMMPPGAEAMAPPMDPSMMGGEPMPPAYGMVDDGSMSPPIM